MKKFYIIVSLLIICFIVYRVVLFIERGPNLTDSDVNQILKTSIPKNYFFSFTDKDSSTPGVYLFKIWSDTVISLKWSWNYGVYFGIMPGSPNTENRNKIYTHVTINNGSPDERKLILLFDLMDINKNVLNSYIVAYSLGQTCLANEYSDNIIISPYDNVISIKPNEIKELMNNFDNIYGDKPSQVKYKSIEIENILFISYKDFYKNRLEKIVKSL